MLEGKLTPFVWIQIVLETTHAPFVWIQSLPDAVWILTVLEATM